MTQDTIKADGLDTEVFPTNTPYANAAIDITENLQEEIPGMAEACRHFPLPTPNQARFVMRELSWGEHYVATRMVPSKGGSDLYLYSLQNAATFLLDRNAANIGSGEDQIIKLIDIDGFISWIQNTIGDTDLAAALKQDCPAKDPYSDRLENVQRLIALRMVQYNFLTNCNNSHTEEA